MGQDASPGEDSRSAPTVPAGKPSSWPHGDDRQGSLERPPEPEGGITKRCPLYPNSPAFFFFSNCFEELRFGPLIHTLNSTCSKAITQDALNKVGICLALHKPFTVS